MQNPDRVITKSQIQNPESKIQTSHLDFGSGMAGGEGHVANEDVWPSRPPVFGLVGGRRKAPVGLVWSAAVSCHHSRQKRKLNCRCFWFLRFFISKGDLMKMKYLHKLWNRKLQFSLLFLSRPWWFPGRRLTGASLLEYVFKWCLSAVVSASFSPHKFDGIIVESPNKYKTNT